MYQSSVLLDIHRESIDIELQLPPSRLAEALMVSLTQASLPTVNTQIQRYCTSHLTLTGPGGEQWALSNLSPVTWQTVDGAPYVVLRMAATVPRSTSSQRFAIHDGIITDRLSSHSILVTVRSDWETSIFASDPNLVGILNASEPSLSIDLGQGSWTRGFRSVFHLGMRHIAEGTDHLLFLLALLLPAPLAYRAHHWAGPIGIRASVLRIATIATAFTLGHSLTLALAAFDIVHTPERPIEVLIAVSILISAINAIQPIFAGRDAWIAAGFGLIHGLAFATTLADLGLKGWTRLQGILAFNLGIETMQLVVICFVMPSLLLMSRTKFYSAIRLAGATFAMFASGGWIIERVRGTSLHIDEIINVAADRSITIAIALLIVAVAAYTLERRCTYASLE